MNILTRNELKEMLDSQEDFLLINVLSEESFFKAHIPGSSNIPISGSGFLQKVVDKTGTQNKNYRIVTYCGGFHCSASKDAAYKLMEAGYKNVSAFEGGMEDWSAAGYPIVSETSKTGEERCAG